MSEIPLVVVEGCDYLGVLLWHKLSWSPHVNHICNKINRTLKFLIRKNLHHTQQSTDIKGCTYKQTTIYSVTINAIDYCSAIWDPYTKVKSDIIIEAGLRCYDFWLLALL